MTLTSVFAAAAIFSQAESQPAPVLSEGESIWIRMHYEVLEGDCVRFGSRSTEWDVQIVQGADGAYDLFIPDTMPEDVGIPMLAKGRRNGTRFTTDFSTTYRMRFLDRLDVSQRIEGELLDGGQRMEAIASIVARADNMEPGHDKEAAGIRKAYAVPCTLKARLTGTRIEPRQVDRAARLKVYDAVKAHMDLLLMQRTADSIVPLEEALADSATDKVPLLWRKARALYVLGERLPNKDTEARLDTFTRGKETAEAAIALDDSNGAAHFYRAANMGRLNTTKGRLATVFGLEDFERQCLMAVERKADFSMFGFAPIGDAHYALGQFYRLVPDSWVVEMLLGTRGSKAKAAKHQRLAYDVQNMRGDYVKEVGVSLICLGNEEDDPKKVEEGKEWLRKAREAPVWAFDRALDDEQIDHLLANPDQACSFSRDIY